MTNTLQIMHATISILSPHGTQYKTYVELPIIPYKTGQLMEHHVLFYAYTNIQSINTKVTTKIVE